MCLYIYKYVFICIYVHTCVFIYIYIYVCVCMCIYMIMYEERLKKQNNAKIDEIIMKVNVEHFGCNNLLQDVKFVKNAKMTMNI